MCVWGGVGGGAAYVPHHAPRATPHTSHLAKHCTCLHNHDPHATPHMPCMHDSFSCSGTLTTM